MNLYEAIRDNNVKKVKSILSKNRDVVNSSRSYGSPLLISAEGGYVDIMKILLKHHAGDYTLYFLRIVKVNELLRHDLHHARSLYFVK